jgi:hypothetical protein
MMSKNPLCKHGDLYYCKQCGGKGRCPHGRIRYSCKDCNVLGTGGEAICEHNNRRYRCVECKVLGVGGSSLCEHNKVKRNCIQCGGAGICEHGRQKSNCKKCSGFVRLARTMHQSAKKRAKKKSLPFELSVQDVLDLIGSGICPIFGTPFETGFGLHKTSASLDRFKPELGYTKENCSVISHLANAMKQGANADEIQRLADWVRSKEKTQ